MGWRSSCKTDNTIDADLPYIVFFIQCLYRVTISCHRTPFPPIYEKTFLGMGWLLGILCDSHPAARRCTNHPHDLSHMGGRSILAEGKSLVWIGCACHWRSALPLFTFEAHDT